MTYSCALTLPEGKEDDRFDCEELEDRVVRTQELLGGEVKEEECVQSQGYGYVVDHCDIQVTTLRSVSKQKKTRLILILEQENHNVVKYAVSKIEDVDFFVVFQQK